jgi:predicted MFS family arabinose efflux permease
MTSNRDRMPLAYPVALAAAGLCYLALGSVLAILPRYVPARLGGGATAIGLAVGAPALTGLLGRPLGGRIADRHGPLTPLLAGAGLMTLGAIPAAVSATLGALLASRLAVGFGEGLMMSATVLWLLRLAGEGRRGRAVGHIGLANYAGLALGPALDAGLGGQRATTAVLWAAAVLPLLGAAAALITRRLFPAAARSRPPADAPEHSPALELLRRTAPAGVGLLLVNIGYVSILSFGASVARANGTGIAALIVPVFGAVIIASRTLGGGIPDRLGGRRTVLVFAATEALGLLIYSRAGGTGLAVAALLGLSLGQSMAVPGLGLLALGGVRPSAQGAAAGLFFAWFDAGVGLGGPLVGAAASLAGPAGALQTAAVAVAGAIALAGLLGPRPQRCGLEIAESG